jgi:hypothetical protein
MLQIFKSIYIHLCIEVVYIHRWIVYVSLTHTQKLTLNGDSSKF